MVMKTQSRLRKSFQRRLTSSLNFPLQNLCCCARSVIWLHTRTLTCWMNFKCVAITFFFSFKIILLTSNFFTTVVVQKMNNHLVYILVVPPPYLLFFSDAGKSTAERYGVYSLSRAEKCESGQHECVWSWNLL